MHSVVRIYRDFPTIRVYALRGGLSFASMMAIWSCMAFHLAGEPFHAGSDAVGLLGYIGLVLAIMLVDVGAQCQQLSNQSGCLAMVPEATNRCNTVYMSHLFASGSLVTLSAGMAWNWAGWTGVCFVGVGFALSALAVTVIFNSRKDTSR